MRHSIQQSRGIRWLAVAALTIPLAVFGYSNAQAEAAGPYNIDGSVPDAGTTELPDNFESGSVKELGPLNSSTTKIGVIHNDRLPTLGLTNPNAQVDLKRAWLDTGKDTQTGDDWLYFGWERWANSGSGFIAYEFMKNAVDPVACAYESRTQQQLIDSCNPWASRQGGVQDANGDWQGGDFMILWDQQGGGKELLYREWQGEAPNLTLTPAEPLSSAYAKAEYSTDGFEGEAAVNLTQTVFKDNPGCSSFANTIPSTVTGNSDTADYKDTILTPAPTITNCGIVQIKKVTSPAEDQDKTTFGWSLARAGGADLRYTGTDKKTVAGNIQHGGTTNVLDLIPGTDYRLTEPNQAAPKYKLDSISCVLKGVTYNGVPGDGVTGNFPVEAGETTVCTLTNKLQPGTLIVKKEVINDDGGTKKATDFSFEVGSDPAVVFTQDGLDESKGLNELTVDAGTYSVVEADLPIAGYTTTYNNCTNVEVPAGGRATCTITNDDQPATLIVKKLVINDNGGTQVATQFKFQVNGGSEVDFLQDPNTIDNTIDTLKGRNDLTVDAGTYTVTEPAVDGYTTTYENCSNVQIPNGGTATCTITNDDTKASPNGDTTQSWVLHDELTITGLRAGGGEDSATFKLWSDDTCTTSQVGTSETVPVDGSVAKTSTGVSVTETGDYYWTVEYSGNQFNEGFTTACGDEISQIRALDARGDDIIRPEPEPV